MFGASFNILTSELDVAYYYYTKMVSVSFKSIALKCFFSPFSYEIACVCIIKTHNLVREILKFM